MPSIPRVGTFAASVAPLIRRVVQHRRWGDRGSNLPGGLQFVTLRIDLTLHNIVCLWLARVYSPHYCSPKLPRRIRPRPQRLDRAARRSFNELGMPIVIWVSDGFEELGVALRTTDMLGRACLPSHAWRDRPSAKSRPFVRSASDWKQSSMKRARDP